MEAEIAKINAELKRLGPAADDEDDDDE